MDFSKYKTKLPFPTGTKLNNPERATYRADQRRLEAEFKKDALKEAGIENPRTAEFAWRIAWENGHAEGLEAVWYELEELGELVRLAEQEATA